MNNLPFVSIIMPIRNEKEYIIKSLGAVLNQDYPKDRMEVIVVDGMSDDGTRKIIEKFKEENIGHKILILDNPFEIVPTALNTGLKHAKGEIIIRVDGHTVIETDYVRRCVETLNDKKADCVGGHQSPSGKGIIKSAVSLATKSFFGIGNAKFRSLNKEGWTDTVYMGAYRKEVFERIGNFDEELMCNEDDEFNFRLIQAGGKIWLDSSIRSIYYCRSTLKGLFKQYFQYGLWKVRVFQKRKRIISLRHIIPSIFLLSLFASVFFSLITNNISYFLIVLTPYLILNLFFSLFLALQNKNILAFFLLPFCFSTIHFSYGLGFLFGLLKFRRYGFGFFKINKN